ncbi:MAG TPA: HAD-IA family hydrolase [Gemmatimonadales bacterium]|nr:HAD-IA family hydrolase [Gemmatimonadales bacterium]
MALDGVIFDVDGTLIDSNSWHVEAWVRAFAAHGYRIPEDRIALEVGKGGDHLVPAVLGPRTGEREKAALGETQKRHFLELAAHERFAVFPEVPELFQALRKRGLRTALATSSDDRHLDATLRSARIDLREIADEVVTKSEAPSSKPDPDLVQAAVAALGLDPAQCAMVGDTTYDAEACRSAGVICLGVSSGGTGADDLLEGGARAVWRDTGHLLEELEDALAIASPGSLRLDRVQSERLMREALAAAREGMARGEVPIGSVLARGDGTVVGRGWNALQATDDRTAHAEMTAFGSAAGRIPSDARDVILVSTLEPCVMCTGAAMEAAVDTILYGLRAPADSGTTRVRPPRSPETRLPRIVGGVLEQESRALFHEWLRTDGNPRQRPYVEQLLALTD